MEDDRVRQRNDGVLFAPRENSGYRVFSDVHTKAAAKGMKESETLERKREAACETEEK